MSFTHQCIITIDNSKNPSDLILQSISGPDGSGAADGTFSLAIESGLVVAAYDTLSFQLTGGDFASAGAALVWLTGDTANNSQALITTTFKNAAPVDNVVTLTVNAASENSAEALSAYGISYFYASQDNDSPKSRDYINKLDHMLAGTPVYADYTIAYNSFSSSPVSFLPGITNVVMLMLENRAFDHLLGMLYTTSPQVVYPEGSMPPANHSTISHPINFDGLFNNPGFSNSSGGTTVTISPVSGTLNIPSPDPGEGWLNTNQQVFNSADTSGTANMQGFLTDYIAQASPQNPIPDVDQIMQYYTPEDLPVISGLAKGYAVSDAWYASIPSQTTPNRAFSLSGTSNGYVDNSKDGKPIGIHNFLYDSVRYGSTTLFNVLSNCGLENNWTMYYEDALLESTLTEHLFDQLHQYKGTDKIKPLSSTDSGVSTFLTDIANNTLPAFSYLEPAWYESVIGTENGTDYHPPANLCEGEQNLAKIYEALTGYANWNSTLLIVTFDEHGGTFDHVPPPATIAPDQQTDWSGFTFDRLGIRIPTLLISPLIKAGTVFRSPTGVPFDHTSLLKTILGWQQIDVSSGVMGARAAQAPDFSGVLSDKVVNSTIVQPSVPVCPSGDLYQQPPSDLQTLLLPLLAQRLSGGVYGSPEHQQIYAELSSIKTLGALKEYVHAKTGK